MEMICEKSGMALVPDSLMSIDGQREALLGLNALPFTTRPPSLHYSYSFSTG